MSKELVLASASPRRRDLLQQIGLSFRLKPAAVDESAIVSEHPADLVAQAAILKASAVAATEQMAIVLGADTVVALGSHVLGKPADADDAKQSLQLLAGKTHTVYTGICLIDSQTGRQAVATEATEVTMRPFPQAEIEAYVASGEPLDKAGAYAIQGLGAVLVERIEGCYFNVVGLPLPRLYRMLEDFSISVWG